MNRRSVVVWCPAGSNALGSLSRLGFPRYDGELPVSLWPGKFWYARSDDRLFVDYGNGGAYDAPMSTEEIVGAFERGYSVWICDGPFETREEAHYALDVAWEAFNDD